MAIRVKSNPQIVQRIIVFSLIFALILSSAVALLATNRSAEAASAFGRTSLQDVPASDLVGDKQIIEQFVSNDGDVYIVTVSSAKLYDFYHFDKEFELIVTGAIPLCDTSFVNGPYSSSTIGSIGVDEEGSIYVTRTDVSDKRVTCMLKFDSTGQALAGFPYTNPVNDLTYGKIEAASDGSVYFTVNDFFTLRTVINKINFDGQLIQSISPDSEENGIPNNLAVNDIVTNDEHVYFSLTDGGTRYMYVFSLNGTFLRSMTVYGYFDRFAVTENRRLISISTMDGNVQEQNFEYGWQMGVTDIFNDPSKQIRGLSSNGMYVVSYDNSSNSILLDKLLMSPVSVPVIQVDDITETTASVSFDVNDTSLLDGADAFIDYRVYEQVTGNDVVESSFAAGDAPETIHLSTLTEGTAYVVVASLRNSVGSSELQYNTFSTTAVYIEPEEPEEPEEPVPGISEVSLYTSDDGKKIMKIDGYGFGNYGDALDISAVSIDDDELGFCADGTFLSYDALAGIYPLVSNEAPCYWVLLEGGAVFPFTDTQILVWLPDDFDLNKKGEVTVLDTYTHTYNESSTPTLPAPTVEVEGGDITSTPTLSKYPVFTGTAAPHAQVVVTIHSDPVTCETVADANGDWRCAFATALQPGSHTVYVKVTNPDTTVVNMTPYAIAVNAELAGGNEVITPAIPQPSSPQAQNQGARSTGLVARGGVAVIEEESPSETEDSTQPANTTQTDIDVQDNENISQQNSDKSESAAAPTWWAWVLGGLVALGALIAIIVRVKASKNA